MFKTLDDYNKKGKSEKVTESYTGGEKSGMAVENPDDIEGVLKKAKENSEKFKDDGEERKKPDRNRGKRPGHYLLIRNTYVGNNILYRKIRTCIAARACKVHTACFGQLSAIVRLLCRALAK